MSRPIDSGKQRVAILTTFMEFNPGYSLTGIVKDQVEMLRRYGHGVHLYVNEKYHGEDFPADVVLEKKIPFAHLKDYMTEPVSNEHQVTVQQTIDMLAKEMSAFPIIFTHDLIFQGWNLPYLLGIRRASRKVPSSRWFHWIHSVPSGNRAYWNIQKLGPFHKIIYPNETDRLRVAEQFSGGVNDVRVIPHIRDLRSWMEFSDETVEFIDDHPEVMQADIVQVYPASVDRLHAKRVKEVISIFGELKKRGQSVCLVIANQWATQRQRQQSVDDHLKEAEKHDLLPGVEVIFTSKWGPPKYEVGIPRRMVRELFQCSNLFIFPTREESFGLVLPEASLAGGVFVVVNNSLAMQKEISGHLALGFDFGSFHQDLSVPHPAYHRDIAIVIIGRMMQNEAVQLKSFMRKKYNWDALYRTYYEPIMAESASWGNQ